MLISAIKLKKIGFVKLALFKSFKIGIVCKYLNELNGKIDSKSRF
jgi:hypothetical protein